MLRRVTLAAMTVFALALGVASATSLGAFGAPVATGLTQDVQQCTYDNATALDGPLDLLLLETVLPASEITSIELTGLDGDCEGHVPIVVVEGIDLVGGGTDEVLFVIDQFPALQAGDTDTEPFALPITPPIPLGDGLLDVFSIPTNVRVAFCPGGATCT